MLTIRIFSQMNYPGTLQSVCGQVSLFATPISMSQVELPQQNSRQPGMMTRIALTTTKPAGDGLEELELNACFVIIGA